MLRAKLPLFGLLALALSLFPDACIARGKHKHCGSSFCGNINITYPFRLKSQPHRCGYNELELVCENSRTIFPMKHGNFYVQHISYSNKTIQLLDMSLDEDNCSIPHSSYPFYQTTTESSIMYLVNCPIQINNSWVYIDAFRCTKTPCSRPPYFYFLDENTAKSDFHESCTVEAQVPIMVANITGLSTFDIYTKLLEGFQLSWSSSDDDMSRLLSLLWLLLRPLTLYILSIMALFQPDYFYAPSKGIQILCLAITGFKNKLGQGGYGSVFKGKLRSGQFVAIKLLNKSKANGQDFINEVATIGRIHHVNVMKPTDRPSMSKVLKMLESEVELLEMPPKPAFS
ncbi:Uncharacterized protein TCM_032090 [Theobroma cacao]|uniref:Protein kinase domain-containing protein n=1 Tax=Theobroma cacao TaxID=3641 RepID=A0A061FG89_THECC|nr:Uncharacterized protein TCM_032090 [Theobroma cacao]